MVETLWGLNRKENLPSSISGVVKAHKNVRRPPKRESSNYR
jgi:hypothetical protein